MSLEVAVSFNPLVLVGCAPLVLVGAGFVATECLMSGKCDELLARRVADVNARILQVQPDGAEHE